MLVMPDPNRETDLDDRALAPDDTVEADDQIPAVTTPPAPEPLRRLALRWLRRHARAITTFTMVAVAVTMVLWVLNPPFIFADNTPTGGDNGAHVAVAAFLRDHLLPHWRLFGWDPNNYAGFPLLQFYFPLPPLLVVMLDLVLPYGVAFKIVTTLGIVTMPISAWAFGRMTRLRFPMPGLLAVSTIPFLFDRGYAIYGGNVSSTLVGEYHYSIALSMLIVYAGALIRFCEQRRGRGLLAVLLSAMVLTHLIVAVFAAVVTLAVVIVYRPGRPRMISRLIAPLGVGGLITSFWLIPFLATHAYTADGGFEKISNYQDLLFPARNLWAIVLAVIGLGAGISRRHRPVMALGLTAAFTALTFRYIPRTRLWNGRIVPMFYLCTFLLAAFGMLELIGWVVGLVRGRREDGTTPPLRLRHQVVGALAVTLAIFVYQGLPLGVVPGSTLHFRTATRTFLGLGAKDAGLRNWADWNYTGYESKGAWPEYAGLNDLMGAIGREHGCGRALYQYEPDQTRFGSPMALDIMNYWTNECIGSLEGLFIEASPTSPFHFLLGAEAAVAPSTPVFGIPYRSAPDLDIAVSHMRLLGVRYYMAFTPELVEKASTMPDFVEVGSFQRWHVFQLVDSNMVEGVNILPIVNPKMRTANYEQWTKSSLTVWDRIGDQQFYVAADGPADWPRIEADGTLPTTYIDPAKVSNFVEDPEGTSLEFDVDQIGKPVVVRVSYFPNWVAQGAKGPYRVSPNLMMVVPTSTHVRLYYSRTSAEKLGMITSGIGLGGLGSMWWTDRRRRRRSAAADLEIEPVGV